MRTWLGDLLDIQETDIYMRLTNEHDILEFGAPQDNGEVGVYQISERGSKSWEEYKSYISRLKAASIFSNHSSLN